MSSARRFAPRSLGLLIPFSLLFSAVFVSGCGSGEPFSYVKASGKVTYDDGSLIQAPQVRLTFIAENPPTTGDEKIHARPATTYANPKTGEFSEITSHSYDDGLLSGKHKVIVNPTDERGTAIDGVVAPEYRDANKTPLEVDTANQPFVIKVKKPAGGVKPVTGSGGRRGER